MKFSNFRGKSPFTFRSKRSGNRSQYQLDSSSKGFSMNIKVDTNEIAYTLCSAMEGGSGYWCHIHQIHCPKPRKGELSKEHMDSHGKFKKLVAPFLPGGYVLFETQDPDTGEKTGQKRLDSSAIQRGLDLMAQKIPRLVGSIVTGEADAMEADQFLQLCLLGEAKYG